MVYTADRVAALRLPAIYFFPETAEEDGLAAYGPRLSALNEVMARQVVQLFRGSKVADIPVEQATNFVLKAASPFAKKGRPNASACPLASRTL